MLDKQQLPYIDASPDKGFQQYPAWLLFSSWDFRSDKPARSHQHKLVLCSDHGFIKCAQCSLPPPPPNHLEMVVYEGAIREKPSSKEEARQFIKGYSGGHAVTVSSVLVMNLKTGFRKGEWDKVEIYFHDILDQVIDNLIEEGFVLSCWRVGHRTSFNTTLR
ncbi:7-methyl-GTP pyrophosphatase [Camellia lanceoleosa]|uniref:7-methyl-GTP pyrophosphatase n=1 Tax=Camellia lanceoleosa TaxID=1840588 RepID=A0ACC0HIG4_9ERIC|nr:7-methyl-GTP pyrophosphatase [Camellia lanceoleosa]